MLGRSTASSGSAACAHAGLRNRRDSLSAYRLPAGLPVSADVRLAIEHTLGDLAAMRLLRANRDDIWRTLPRGAKTRVNLEIDTFRSDIVGRIRDRIHGRLRADVMRQVAAEAALEAYTQGDGHAPRAAFCGEHAYLTLALLARHGVPYQHLVPITMEASAAPMGTPLDHCFLLYCSEPFPRGLGSSDVMTRPNALARHLERHSGQTVVIDAWSGMKVAALGDGGVWALAEVCKRRLQEVEPHGEIQALSVYVDDPGVDGQRATAGERR